VGAITDSEINRQKRWRIGLRLSSAFDFYTYCDGQQIASNYLCCLINSPTIGWEEKWKCLPSAEALTV
jgi:hypothetical protein